MCLAALPVSRRGALVMQPLLLHASSKASITRARGGGCNLSLGWRCQR
jgi:hypothetical protein